MLIDLDLDLTASNQIKQFAGQIGLFCRVSNVIGKCRTSQVQRAFDCQQYRVERRDRAGCSANTDHQATALEGVQRAREGVFADTVKHHVYANAAGQLTDPFGDVFVAVIDHMVATMGTGYLAFGIAGHSAYDFESQQFCPLRNNQADASGCGRNHDCVALADDHGVDSIYSQQFSIGVFFFMLLAIVFFASIVMGFVAGKHAKGLKCGEKWLFAWIFLGIVVAVILGALQLLGGYLL